MTETESSPDRRAKVTAILGMLFQVAFFAVLVAVGRVYKSDAVLAAARFTFGGIFIWPVLAMVYGQRKRMLDERREAEELKRTRSAEGVAAIFEAEDEAYLIERRRLNWMMRWLVPSAVVLLALYHLVIALAEKSWWIFGSWLGWEWSWGTPLRDASWRLADQRGITMTFVGGVGFVAFLFSRYTAGMARVSGWRMLRSGASYLAGNALACLVVLIAIGVQRADFPIAEALAAYVIRVTLLVLGIEFVVNFILDFYRPRTAGEESRPAFDSRLLALITEPGGIARSLADAINYQFGFEVSSTWFYQLLKRALLPMVAFGVLVLFALSSVIIVDVDEQAVIERFGHRLQGPGEALGPGLWFKYPFPIDVEYTAPVEQIRSFTVGDTPAQQNEYEEFEGKRRLRPILWGEKHEFNAEMMLVLASRSQSEAGQRQRPSPVTEDPDSEAEEDRTTPAALLMISVDIQYRIKDIHGYLYKHVEPEKFVENVAYQVLTDFAAGVTEDRFLGPGRAEVNRILAQELQRRLDEQELGIEILFVALQEAHPSDTVASAYQDVVKAEIAKEAAIENARKVADTILTTVAGSKSRALALDRAIEARDQLGQQADADPDALARAEQAVDDLLMGSLERNIAPTGGEAAKRIADAKAQVQAEISSAERNLTLFNAELTAYQAAPAVYRMRKYLETLVVSTAGIRKYVVATDPAKHLIVEYEKEEKSTIEIEDFEQ